MYSDEIFYHYSDPNSVASFMGLTNGTCSNDAKSYQFCGTTEFDKNIFVKTDEILCGYSFCHYDSNSLELLRPVSIAESLSDLTDSSKSYCDSYISYNTELSRLSAESICDEICDLWDCKDESFCGSYTYGLFCPLFNINSDQYVQPIEICDGIFDCVNNKKDEKNCNEIEGIELNNMCRRYHTGKIVRIFNYIRCSAIRFRIEIYHIMIRRMEFSSILKTNGKYALIPYCTDYTDQTNCSDINRVALNCNIGGYLSSVSKVMVCSDKSLRLRMCEDGMDILCVDTSPSCTIHKHLMCNGISDCYDNSDELSESCNSMTHQSCFRKYLHIVPLGIPLAWLADGDNDCLNSEDEESAIWPRCGIGKLHRYVLEETACTDVFICQNGPPNFIETSKLCDGIESCGNENEICQKTLNIQHKFVGLHVNHENKFHKSAFYCLKGLWKLAESRHPCSKISIDISGQTILGSSKFELTLPNTVHDCRYMYGELYFYLSCLGYCKVSKCPLYNRKEVVRHDACTHQYHQRIYTLVNNSALTFVVRKEGTYVNDYFLCNNSYCTEFSKVCNMVDDCGDASDEMLCNNQFKCNKTDQILPINQKCDTRIDCFDFSDECNEECSNNILSGISQLFVALIVGSLATFLNVHLIFSSALKLRGCKKFLKLFNKIMIIQISLGDLSVGFYLLSLGVIDLFIFKDVYCFQQYKWLTNSWCSLLGSLNTFGSQLSIFSMAVLSAQRASGIKNMMVFPKSVSKKNGTYLCILIISLVFVSITIAIIPLIGSFEDYFVNGLIYDQSMRLFTEMVSKETHFSALKSYYGRMKDKTLTWKLINEMMYKVFSHDYNLATEFKKKVHFYGNDGVCLFKYFVKKEDPQWAFSLMLLTLNVCCFVIIAICYSYISVVTIKGSKMLVKSPGAAGKQVRARNKKMQQRIIALIATDFICWVPFVGICLLNFSDIIDATPMYSTFSVIVLPINSVINPLLYNSQYVEFIKSTFFSILKMLTGVWNLILRLEIFKPQDTNELDTSLSAVECCSKESKPAVSEIHNL